MRYVWCVLSSSQKWLIKMMKKLVMILLAVAFVSMPAEAQLFKKLFKKKAKTEKKSSAKSDAIDDDAQVALADVATFSDNRNNRNAFL